MIYSFALVPVLLLICGIVLQYDDDLVAPGPDYIELINQRRASGSEAYFYLRGIGAPADKDPLQYGKRIAQGLDDEGRIDAELLEPASDHPLYCALDVVGCYQTLLQSQATWQAELDQSALVLDRYRQFLSYGEFVSIAKPALDEEYPRYRPLRFGNRLQLLQALVLAQNEQTETAVALLLEENRKLRQQLVVADTLIHKLFFASLIGENLEGLLLLHRHYRLPSAKPIPELSPKEFDMLLPFAREFVLGYNTFVALDGSPELFEEEGDLPRWVSQMLFKPNMTVNVIAKEFGLHVSLSHLRTDDFALAVESLPPEQALRFNIRNVVGSILSNVAAPAYSDFTARLHDLNCKIVLANYVLNNQPTLPSNPYGSADYGVDREADRLCMQGPFEDSGNLRCIWIDNEIDPA